MRIITFIICLLSSCVLHAYEMIVLNPTESMSLEKQCSREGPENISGTWKVDENTLNEIKSNLKLITKIKNQACCGRTSILEIEQYHFQIAGLIIKGRKVVYINAVHKSAWEHLRDKNKAAIACDGGALFWGVIFDPETKLFSQLNVNGAI